MHIPTDVLVEILGRLPWTSRRRLRLVCRTWRNLVHQRTTEMQECREALPLVVTTKSAYLHYYRDLSKTCIIRELWSSGWNPYKHTEVVGVCNGVVCLCDDTKPGGTITLANPATGDILALPPIPCAGLFCSGATTRGAPAGAGTRRTASGVDPRVYEEGADLDPPIHLTSSLARAINTVGAAKLHSRSRQACPNG
ncbi:hypothetical protein ACQ4PT_029264 [Festuca glaucescens]